MKISPRKRRRKRYGGAGMELVGALSIASQMALLCPPGFDEWVRHELGGDPAAGNGSGNEHSAAPGRRS
jgi:hypothetical protein